MAMVEIIFGTDVTGWLTLPNGPASMFELPKSEPDLGRNPETEIAAAALAVVVILLESVVIVLEVRFLLFGLVAMAVLFYTDGDGGDGVKPAKLDGSDILVDIGGEVDVNNGETRSMTKGNIFNTTIKPATLPRSLKAALRFFGCSPAFSRASCSFQMNDMAVKV